MDASVVRQRRWRGQCVHRQGPAAGAGQRAGEDRSRSSDSFQPERLTLALQSPSGPTDITGSLSGGSVGGLLNFRREMLDPARNELGRMAVALTQRDQ